ncbi:hypothetical protein GW17_00009334 [Ensete ventricosum]|nr:hypothetical protein GW17_00009334 [Ensete ventricosum]
MPLSSEDPPGPPAPSPPKPGEPADVVPDEEAGLMPPGDRSSANRARRRASGKNLTNSAFFVCALYYRSFFPPPTDATVPVAVAGNSLPRPSSSITIHDLAFTIRCRRSSASAYPPAVDLSLMSSSSSTLLTVEEKEVAAIDRRPQCYLEVLEQDARAGDGGCCYLSAWEQDAKMVGGGRGRWTSVRDRSVKEKQQIWFGISCLDAQAAAEAGLSWSWLPLERIRRCGCRRGELGIAIVDLK